jgi:hypothetical protein
MYMTCRIACATHHQLTGAMLFTWLCALWLLDECLLLAPQDNRRDELRSCRSAASWLTSATASSRTSLAGLTFFSTAVRNSVIRAGSLVSLDATLHD